MAHVPVPDLACTRYFCRAHRAGLSIHHEGARRAACRPIGRAAPSCGEGAGGERAAPRARALAPSPRPLVPRYLESNGRTNHLSMYWYTQGNCMNCCMPQCRPQTRVRRMSPHSRTETGYPDRSPTIRAASSRADRRGFLAPTLCETFHWPHAASRRDEQVRVLRMLSAGCSAFPP